MARYRHDAALPKAGGLTEDHPGLSVDKSRNAALEVELGEPNIQAWSEASATDLMGVLASLEADVPEEELAKWLAAFHSM